ncbi:hypothetical protein [Streptomyces albidoflavus]|uniref:hypothetical protein n=1 Tax=Streptomyces albidoflavus TaxID=1886 RepID=UPI00340E3DA9
MSTQPLTDGLTVVGTLTLTKTFITHGHRLVGVIEGNPDVGYTAEYHWPRLSADGAWHGGYRSELHAAFPGVEGYDDAAAWLSECFDTRPTGRALGAPANASESAEERPE